MTSAICGDTVEKSGSLAVVAAGPTYLHVDGVYILTLVLGSGVSVVGSGGKDLKSAYDSVKSGALVDDTVAALKYDMLINVNDLNELESYNMSVYVTGCIDGNLSPATL